MAFEGAAALGGDALDDLVPDSEEIRRLRAGSRYDAEIAGVVERNIALDWMRRTLPVIRAALTAADPALASLLLEYP